MQYERIPDWLSGWNSTLTSASNKLSLGAVLVGISLFGASIVVPITFDVSQADRVLQILATAQASILAIVFSVTLLGAQLVADRYSPRLVTLLTTGNVFQKTFLYFVVSILLDLILLLILPSLSSPVILGATLFAGCIMIAVIASLRQFLTHALEWSTPEGLLEVYSSTLTVDEFQKQAKESRGSGTELHPLHELHSVVMSGLSNGEWAAAENGLNTFERVSNQLLFDLNEEGELKRTNSHSRAYFRTPLEEYLPRIAATAIEKGEEDIAKQVPNTIHSISVSGIENHHPRITSAAATGLSEIRREAPDGKEGDSLRRSSLNTYQELVPELAELPAPRDIDTFLSMYANQFRILLGRDREPWTYRHTLDEFFDRSVRQAHATTLEQFGEYIQTVEYDWRSEYLPDSLSNNGPVRILFSYRRYSAEVTGHMFEYFDRNDEWPMGLGAYRGAWRRMLEDAIESGAEMYAAALCQHYIDISYAITKLNGDSGATWASELARVRGAVDNEAPVDQAFETLLEEGMTPAVNSELFYFRSNPLEDESFFERLASGPEIGHDHEDWVREFREQTEAVYEEYHAEES